MQRVILAVAGVCLCTAWAWADEPEIWISTKDGRTFQGRLVAEDDAGYVVEVEREGYSAQVTVPRDDVASAQRVGPDPADQAFEARLAEVRAIREPGPQALALLELAHQQELRGDPAKAAAVYAEAGRVDPALRDQTEIAEARSWMAADRYVLAERTLRRALERNPKHARGLALSRQLAASFAEKAERLLEPGIQAYLDDHPRRALSLLTEAVEQLPDPVLDQASERLRAQVGLGLADVMVDCRLRRSCGACDGAGVFECPSAASNAPTRCRFGRRTTKLRFDELGGARLARWSWCRDCNGLGHLNCEDCGGLGTQLSQPTRYEREAFTEAVTGTLTSLQERADGLLGRVDAGDQSDAVRSVAATELLGVLSGIRGYSKALTELDPAAGAPGGGDLRRRTRETSQRMAAIMTALANALYVVGEQRYDDAVGAIPSPFADDAKFLTPEGRAIRARQSWEIVNQARAFTLEALELNPATAGPTNGDLKRRLALMDRFLKRTWRTYAQLSMADQSSGVNVSQILDAAASLIGGAR